jgi:competence protein ComEC
METSSQHAPFQDNFPDLLPWQVCLLFVLSGFYAFRFPVASAVALFLLISFVYHKETFRKYIVPCLFMFCLGFGLAWFYAPQEVDAIPDWMENHEDVLVKARVERVLPKPEHRLYIIVNEAQYTTKNGQTGILPGKIVWKWLDPCFWPCPGQTLLGTVRIKPVRGSLNPGCWDTVAYWGWQGVTYTIFSKGDKDRIRCQGEVSWLWKVRLQIRESIVSQTAPGQGQGLLLALIMGDRFLLSYPVLDLVRRASLAHSLALSGLHLGFLVSMAWICVWLLGAIKPSIYLRMPRQKLVVLISLPLILIYLWLGQAKPSLLRASLMFFFWGWLFLQGRQKFLWDGLFFALLIIFVFCPVSFFDLGLQLSVIAVAGIICFCPGLMHKYWDLFGASRWSSWIFPMYGLLLVSLVATLVLLPLTLWNFGQFNYRLYLNLLWLPVLGWVVLPCGLLGGLLSLLPVLKCVSAGLLSVATQTLNIFVVSLRFLESHCLLEPVLPLRPGWIACFGYWFVLILLFGYWPRIRSVSWWSLAVGFILVFAPVVMREVHLARNEVCLRLIDVGQGQSVLIETPGGRRILIDGGGSWNRDFDLGRFILSPYLTWNRRPSIATVVLSHPDFDHMRGLYYILDHYKVGSFVFNGVWPEGWDKQQLQTILGNENIPVVVWKAGERVDLGQGLTLEVVHPPRGYVAVKDNDASLVLRLIYQGHGLALIPGDIEMPGVKACLSKGSLLEADILVLPHHGSRSSLSAALYRRVDPKIVLASCKFLNYFRFPHKSVQNTLNELDIPLITTARHGLISVTWQLPSLEMEWETMR